MLENVPTRIFTYFTNVNADFDSSNVYKKKVVVLW